jgi:TusA-related sulfurtransferase
MTLLTQRMYEQTLFESLSMEGMSIINTLEKMDAGSELYVLLTDTPTVFSKISKAVTGDPYNHVSLAFDRELENVFTYALKTLDNGFKGGFKREDRKVLRGSRYSLYSVTLPSDTIRKVKSRVIDIEKKKLETSYNHFGLINAVLGRELFRAEATESMICSHFVAAIFEDAGIQLFKNKASAVIRPYDFVKSKLLKHVERGTIR